MFAGNERSGNCTVLVHSLSSSVPKLPNEVTLLKISRPDTTVSNWGYVERLQFGQFVIGRSPVQLWSSAPSSPDFSSLALLLAGVEIRKLLPKVSNLWGIVEDDVWIVGMMDRVVLMVGLSGIKGLQRDYLSHDRTREDFGFL